MCHDSLDRIDPSLDSLIPDNPNKPYDMHELIQKVADDENFFDKELYTEDEDSFAKEKNCTEQQTSIRKKKKPIKIRKRILIYLFLLQSSAFISTRSSPKI